MQRITYYILKLISYLPLMVLYILADVLFVLNHYLIHYRKKVIWQNLKNAFPEKTDLALKKISYQFNRNFCDYLVESVKGLTANPQKMEHRMRFVNPEIAEQYFEKGANVMFLSGHSFNFEWGTFITQNLKFDKVYFIYKPLKNKYINQQVLNLRAKYKASGIAMKDTYRTVATIPNNGRYVYYFLGDQSPKISENKNWVYFLNQETPTFSGFETIAQKYEMKVFYGEFIKLKRGYYEFKITELLPDYVHFQSGEIIKKFYQKLEETIQKDPANWLWSHKRWKHKKSNE